MATLPVDYVDEVLDSTMGGKRRYTMTTDSYGTYFTDVTTYTQRGSTFAAAQINETNTQVNENTELITPLATAINITTLDTTPVAASANANSSVAVGYGANASSNRSTALGYDAYASSYATAVGYGANAQGSRSTALGYSATASGTCSMALGVGANASGNSSKALGCFANASGTASTALGIRATASGTCSMALGVGANASGNCCTAIGHYASASGEKSTALGCFANAIGNYYSTALGCQANASGYESTAVGVNTTASGNYSTALGHYANTSSANTMQLGSSSYLSTLNCRVSLTVTSDERDKADIAKIDSALDFINSLTPVTYVANERGKYELPEEELDEDAIEKRHKYGLYGYDKEEHAKGTKKGTRKRAGLVAQDVQQAMIDAYGSSAYANLVNDNFYDYDDVPEDVENQLTIAYANFVPFLIKAIQELSDKNEALATDVEALKNKS